MNLAVTGAEYVTALTARASDRRSRDAFQALALSLVRPGGAIFDFGCGPGIDARAYAEHGLRVGAYDVDPAMCAHFRAHCAAALARGQVTLSEGSFDAFLAAPASHDYSLVTANFAPLNLAPELPALFTRLAGLLAPGGRLLASVLNPFCASDLRYGWWWRGLPSLLSRGELRVAGAQGDVTRFRPRRLLQLAQPAFALEAWYADHAFDGAARVPPRPLGRFAAGPLLFTSCRYHFLLLRRSESAP